MFSHACIEPLLDYAYTLWDGGTEVHFRKLNAGDPLSDCFYAGDFFFLISYLELLPLHNKCLPNKLVLMHEILKQAVGVGFISVRRAMLCLSCK